MTFDGSSFLAVTGVSLVAVVVLMAATALEGRRQGRVSVVDTTWGLGFVVVALVAALVGEGTGWRRLALVVVVALWGLRLAWHVTRRNAGKGEDPRYVEMMAKEKGNPTWVAIRKVYLVQGLAVWFVSLPIQVSAAAGPGTTAIAVVGLLLWAVGLVFEAVGDAQLKAFKADASHKGKVMDRGLWSWTRHPNYFGDSVVWWGLWLVAASAWPGMLTVLSPVAMTYFLVFATGARLLEAHLAQRPGYADYQRRTSAFLPRPPRRTRGLGPAQ
jgi:steroid 5-alpha reductase family enzyme